MANRLVIARSGYDLSDAHGAIRDLLCAAGRWRLWSAFAIEDIRQTYRRSLIGVAWVALSFAVFVAVKILIFGSMIGGGDNTYFSAYLLLGFFVWQFMSAIVSGSVDVFIRAENWIKNDPIEIPVFVFELAIRKLFDLFLTGLVVFLFYIYLGFGFNLYALLLVPAIALYTLNALWVGLFLGAVCTRFRDIGHLINTIMRVMFFLTPIFWFPSQLPPRAAEILYWNPFAHFLAIARTPILDQDIAVDSWIFVGVFTLIGWILGLSALAIARRRLAFWF